MLAFAPFFWEYIAYAGNHGGVVRTTPTDESFLPDLEALERSLTPRVRAVIVNSPNNPTGVVYSPETLEALAKVLTDTAKRFGTRIFLISDEPYARLIFDGLEYPYLYPYYPDTIVATSFSKDLSLAGERIGYIAVPAGHG